MITFKIRNAGIARPFPQLTQSCVVTLAWRVLTSSLSPPSIDHQENVSKAEFGGEIIRIR